MLQMIIEKKSIKLTVTDRCAHVHRSTAYCCVRRHFSVIKREGKKYCIIIYRTINAKNSTRYLAYYSRNR